MTDLSPRTRLNQSRELFNWIQHRIVEVQRSKSFENPTANQVHVALSLLQTPMDHIKAFFLLFENNLAGVASTLERPIFENYCRTIWLLIVPDIVEVYDIINKDRIPHKLPDLINEIDKVDSKTAGWMKEVLVAKTNSNEKLMDVFHSFVHGGKFQILHRVSIEGGKLSVNTASNPTQEIAIIVMVTDVLIRCAYEIFSLLHDETGLHELLERSNRWRSTLEPI